MVKNPPANAGDAGSIPGPGRSHLTYRGVAKPVHHNYWSLRSRAREPQLLSPRATTTEAGTLGAHVPQQEKPPQREACAPRLRIAPASRN